MGTSRKRTDHRGAAPRPSRSEPVPPSPPSGRSRGDEPQAPFHHGGPTPPTPRPPRSNQLDRSEPPTDPQLAARVSDYGLPRPTSPVRGFARVWRASHSRWFVGSPSRLHPAASALCILHSEHLRTQPGRPAHLREHRARAVPLGLHLRCPGPGDLRPETLVRLEPGGGRTIQLWLRYTRMELRVTLAARSSPHRTRAIAALCEELNRAATRFPGSSLCPRDAVREAD